MSIDWNKVETAPIGERVRLRGWFQRPNGELFWYTEVGMAFEWRDGTWPWSSKQRKITYEGQKSTHWMPLPPPPQNEEPK